MTHRQLARDLLRTPLQIQQHISLTLDPRLDLTRIAAALRSTQRQFAGLLRSIATATLVSAELTTDRGLVQPKLIHNLCDALIGFNEAVNLISFDLAEVFLIHRATSIGRSRSLEC
jgi:hypothetical protein